MGVLIPGASFWWVVIVEEEWGIWFILVVVGLGVFLGGWYLEFLLWLFPYFCGGLLYLVGIVLVCFGAWQAWDEWQFWKNDPMRRYRWNAADSRDGTADSFDPRDDDDSSSHERRNEERADGPQDEVARSFDPWRVLGITPDATQREIQGAFKEQMKRYHPDRVSHLGEELREVAERKTKDINRAYGMLKQQ